MPTKLEPGATDPQRIRNFGIIAHIDHGKSTLADRMLQITGVVDARQMRAQYLDRMDIERERGITIKSQAVRLPWQVREGQHAGEDFVPLPNHEFRWSERSLTTTVDAGLYALCGAPRKRLLSVQANRGTLSSQEVRLRISEESDAARVDLTLDRQRRERP